MGVYDVVQIVLVVLALALPIAIWGIKLYAKTWIPELVKAEVKRQYSLTEESASDRLSACKSLIRLIGDTQKAAGESRMAAKVVLICAVGDEELFAHLLDTVLKKHKPQTLLEGAMSPLFDQVIMATKRFFGDCGYQLEIQSKPLHTWLPDNIETLLHDLVRIYSEKGIQERFEELVRAVREGRVNALAAIKEFQALGDSWEARLDELENKIKVELKRLLGIETPRKPVV